MRQFVVPQCWHKLSQNNLKKKQKKKTTKVCVNITYYPPLHINSKAWLKNDSTVINMA